jgi:hypothetical protein
MSCLLAVGKRKLMVPEYQWKIKIGEVMSGHVLLKIITEIARPPTPASVQMLRNNITNMSDKLDEFGQDIEKFNAYVIEQIHGLNAFGHVYENIEYHLLQAYDKCTDQVFHAYLTKIKDEHETGEKSYTYDEIMKYAQNKFNLMVQKNEWNPEKGSLDDSLLALETKSGRIPRKDRSKQKREGRETQKGREKVGKEYAPKGGNWTHLPPEEGADKKATRTRKNRSGKVTTFYWCSTKNGGKCDPGRWNTNHKPEDCKADEIKAEREKKQKEKGTKRDNDGRPGWLKANETVIEKEDPKVEKFEVPDHIMKEMLEHYETNSLSKDSQDTYDQIHPSFDLEHCLRRRAQRNY